MTGYPTPRQLAADHRRMVAREGFTRAAVAEVDARREVWRARHALAYGPGWPDHGLDVDDALADYGQALCALSDRRVQYAAAIGIPPERMDRNGLWNVGAHRHYGSTTTGASRVAITEENA